MHELDAELSMIRTATLADLAEIVTIYRDAVLHGAASYEIEPPSPAEFEQRFLAITNADYPFLVAEKDGEILGYAYASAFRDRPAYRFMAEDSIYLRDKAQGKGLGKLLLKRLIEQCRERGFRQLLAVIGDGSETSASVRLHRALNFEPCGVIRGSGYKHGRWLDTYIMQLPLGEGMSTAPDKGSVPEQVYLSRLGPK